MCIAVCFFYHIEYRCIVTKVHLIAVYCLPTKWIGDNCTGPLILYVLLCNFSRCHGRWEIYGYTYFVLFRILIIIIIRNGAVVTYHCCVCCTTCHCNHWFTAVDDIWSHTTNCFVTHSIYCLVMYIPCTYICNRDCFSVIRYPVVCIWCFFAICYLITGVIY